MLTPATFVDRWLRTEGGQERANYALFLTELTEALGLPRPEPADSRTTYRFEFPVRGDHGQPYRIDLYKKDCFVLEAKQSRWQGGAKQLYGQAELFSPEQEGAAERTRRWDPLMRNARDQAWNYAARLPAEHDRPPFIVVCDVARTFELYSDFSGQARNYRAFPDERDRVIRLEQLLEPGPRDLLRAIWTEPRTLDPALHRAAVTRDVAAHIAGVSRALEKTGHPPEEVAGFLSRCLFAMFAQSVGLLGGEHRFSTMLERCRENPGAFMPLATQLFEAMDRGDFAMGLEIQLKQFNGAFFKDRRAFPLEREQIGALLEAAGKDWRHVEPAIFGALLEQALSPAERSRLGAHYTPRPYVERLVVATIMEPLRSDWADARVAAEDRRAAGDAAGARQEIAGFHQALRAARVLDPACGTGNFLYVALELIKELEGEVLDALEELGGQSALEGLGAERVDPRQFLGLELNPRAASLAELVLWIGHLQATDRRTRGLYAAQPPILRDYGNIRRVDAVLAHDGEPSGATGYPNPRRPAWPEAEFIVGNPPFIGGKDVRGELGDAYARALWAAHPAMNDSADYVMYWWDRAADILTRRGSALRRFGLVTTNSITQVFQRRTVARWLSSDNPNKTPLHLTFAVADHPWTKATRDAAAVRIAMTAADRGEGEGVLLTVTGESGLETDAPVIETAKADGRIGPDLTIGVDVTAARPLLANEGLCSRGVSLHGSGFIVSRAEAEHLGLGRPDRPGLDQRIRPYRNGRDLTGRSRDKWVIDLTGLTADQVRDRYPEVYQHVSWRVRFDYLADGRTPRTDDKGRRTGREWNARDVYRLRWWEFGEPRRDLRPALDGLPRCIATVETAKHRVFTLLNGAILPDNMLVVVASEDAAHLAVLSSALHVGWSLEQGATLEDRPRYSKSRCFDPFPFPAWTEPQRAALAEAGEALDAFRKARLTEQPQLTLTRLYNALEAHRAERPLTAAETADFEAGSVLILHELHEAVDRLTLEAYGWPADEPEQAMLARIVALNARRRTEEARGDVRWLRPSYQQPRFAPAQVAGPAAVRDLVGRSTAVTSLARDRWPSEKERSARVWAVRAALAELRAPAAPETLAARFKGRGVRPEVERTLLAMQRMGQVGRSAEGYMLLR